MQSVQLFCNLHKPSARKQQDELFVKTGLGILAKFKKLVS
jgi:hypothetical protein